MQRTETAAIFRNAGRAGNRGCETLPSEARERLDEIFPGGFLANSHREIPPPTRFANRHRV